MAMISTPRKFQWRRIRPAAPPRMRVAKAAAEEARLIVTSGELALRHAAELTRHSAEDQAGGPVDLYPARREVSLHREVICYVASIVVSSLMLAIILFFVVPGALRD